MVFFSAPTHFPNNFFSKSLDNERRERYTDVEREIEREIVRREQKTFFLKVF